MPVEAPPGFAVVVAEAPCPLVAAAFPESPAPTTFPVLELPADVVVVGLRKLVKSEDIDCDVVLELFVEIELELVMELVVE